MAKHEYIRIALRRLKVGECFFHHEPYSFTPHSYAKKIGIKIMVRRQHDGRTQVWRIE